MILLYIPLLLLLPISQKSGENLYQITVISAYIRVFYEYATLVEPDSDQPFFAWESINRLTSKVTDKNLHSKLFSFLINNSYSVLAFISILLYFYKGMAILNMKQASLQNYMPFAVSLIFALIILVVVHIYSSINRNMRKPEKQIIYTCVKAAKSIGLFEEEDINDIAKKISELTLFVESKAAPFNKTEDRH